MSRLTEIAAQEATDDEQDAETEPAAPAAEPSDDDEQEAAEEEEHEAAESEPPPPPPPTPEQIEKRYKEATKHAERYIDKLTAILGPEIMAAMVFSPLDTFPGVVEVGPNGEVEPQAREATLAFLNFEPPPAYKANPETRTCQRCGGYGDVLSGAKRKGNELLQCSGCNGRGYTDTDGRPVGMTLASVPVANGALPPPPVEQAHAPGDPRAAELRALGYTVLEPIHVGG